MFKGAFDIWHVYRKDCSIQGLSPVGAYLELNKKFLVFPRTCRYTALSHFSKISRT